MTGLNLLGLFNRFSAASFGTHGLPPSGKRVAGSLFTRFSYHLKTFCMSFGDALSEHDAQEIRMESSSTNAPYTNIRWQIRRDLQEVLDIEQKCFGDCAWNEEEWIHCLRQRNNIAMVAERQDEVVGYMVYELHKNRLHLLNFAVRPDTQRTGVGKAMIDKLKSKLTADRRNRIMLEVHETNLAAQLFYRSHGFKAISVLRDYYVNSPEDAYLMQYRYVATGDAGTMLTIFKGDSLNG